VAACFAYPLAPVDVVLDAHTIAVPDLVFVSSERSSIVRDHAIVGAPDLLVEILSPSTARRDRTVKLRLYARFAVAHYWIVDPAKRELFVFELRGGSAYAPARILRGDEGAELGAPSGFHLDLSRIWA
jgi:Uma2 family endonuclease